jgi:hypothetical protein
MGARILGHLGLRCSSSSRLDRLEADVCVDYFGSQAAPNAYRCGNFRRRLYGRTTSRGQQIRDYSGVLPSSAATLPHLRGDFALCRMDSCVARFPQQSPAQSLVRRRLRQCFLLFGENGVFSERPHNRVRIELASLLRHRLRKRNY